MRARVFGSIVCAVILIVCVAAVRTAAEPTFSFGFKGGINAAKLGGDDTTGFLDIDEYGISASGDIESYRVGFVGGVFFMVHISDMFGIRLEALYAMKGGKGEMAGTISDDVYGDVAFNADATLRLDYFEIPLLAVVSVPLAERVSLNVMAGPTFAFKTGAELALELRAMGMSQEETEDIDELVKGTDVGAVFGAGFTFNAGTVDIFVEGRYGLGFSSIDDTSEDLDLKTRYFSFMAGLGIPFGVSE